VSDDVHPAAHPGTNVLVARQPILDRDATVVAYELLARHTLTDGRWRGVTDDPRTTARVIAQTFLDMDVWSITEGLPAFVNVPRDLLLDGTVDAMPAASTVVELLETVRPDAAVAAACRRLRAAGYRIALDDVVAGDPRLDLLGVVDVVKIDFAATSPAQRAHLLARCRDAGVRVLAEKVETRAQHDEALVLGCDLFQGYFFCRPAVLGGPRRDGAHLWHLQLLRSVIAPEIDRDAIGNVLARDRRAASWLRAVWPTVAGGTPPRTVRTALGQPDEPTLVRLLSLVVVVWLGEGHPRSLLDTTLIRARFCEQVVRRLGDGAAALDGHLVGLCSLLDALVAAPLVDVLARIHAPTALSAACLRGAGPLGHVLGLARAYEQGDWTAVRAAAAALPLDGGLLGPLYLDCLAWARDVRRVTDAASAARDW
jgi:EAL and modified HD-GYP domain-containing signal transduction protein